MQKLLKLLIISACLLACPHLAQAADKAPMSAESKQSKDSQKTEYLLFMLSEAKKAIQNTEKVYGLGQPNDILSNRKNLLFCHGHNHVTANLSATPNGTPAVFYQIAIRQPKHMLAPHLQQYMQNLPEPRSEYYGCIEAIGRAYIEDYKNQTYYKSTLTTCQELAPIINMAKIGKELQKTQKPTTVDCYLISSKLRTVLCKNLDRLIEKVEKDSAQASESKVAE